MLELYAVVLALCGRPNVKNCRVDEIHCYEVKKKMHCTLGVYLKEKGKAKRVKVGK